MKRGLSKKSVDGTRDKWPKVQIQEVCTIRHGGTPSKSNGRYWSGPIPWISPKDMKSSFVSDAQDHISQEAVENSATRIVESGTVLVVVRSGILVRHLPVAVVTKRVAFNQDIKALIPDQNRVMSQYLYWVLRAAEGVILSQGVKKGATVHSLRSGFLETLQIPVPPMSDQKRIADSLTEQLTILEGARVAAEKQLTLLKSMTAALLHAAFDGDF